MEENRVPSGPVPLPRSKPTIKTPVPLPRTTLSVKQEDEAVSEEKDTSKPIKPPRLQHTNSLRKSLRKVTTNVQEKSNAVLLSAKNVSTKMESSVRNILSKRHTVSGSEESSEQSNDVEYVRCQSLPCDDIFRNISFDSPLQVPDDYGVSYDPPPYPPPPPPDESIYDELRSTKSGSVFQSDLSNADNNSVYEEIHGLNNISGACSPCSSAPDEARVLNRSDSWSFYDVPFSVPKPRGHSYENVAIDYLPTESTENIYSDEPARPKIVKKPILLPLDSASVCSSNVMTNECYENWKPVNSCHRGNTSSRSEKSFATKSVIYEFDPLFEGRKKSGKTEKQDSSDIRPNNEIQKCSTFPKLDTLSNCDSSDTAHNSAEYFLYHRAAGGRGSLEEPPKEILVLTQGNKKKADLVRWSSMKRAIKLVTDSAPWSPIGSRKNLRPREEGIRNPVFGPVHNGFIFKSPSNGERAKDFVQKWCQLSDGKMTLANDKNTNNKEVIGVETVLSIRALPETKLSNDGEPLHCWELSTSCRTKPHLFGSASSTETMLWMRTLLESLTNVFPPSLTADFIRAGQCFLKEGVSSDWCGAWILLCNRTLHYCQIEGKLKEIDLRKARFIVLSEDEGKCESTSEVGPYIKVHTVEEVLYIQMDYIRENKAWYTCIKTSALENGTGLAEQQLTRDYVPVIVDKCINFVYAHGSMSEGIYRRSGSSSKVTSLLSLLRKDAWDVQISRQEYTEYDVSTVLKRFFRDLPEPLLTASLYKYFCNVASVKCPKHDKENMYRNYLDKLPQVNYVTLRRLIGHLYFIHELSEKNKMPVENLSAIWAPTLMHVEGKEGMEWTKKECEVITELILNYKSIFQVEDEEALREKRILEVLERVHESPNTLPPPRPSGDLKITIYIGSRRGESVTVPVNPSIDSGKVCCMLADKTDYAPHELCLSECVLNGTLSRPLHHSESVFATVVNWAYWDSSDIKDNYLLLAHNTLYKEILPLAKPPISKSGELKFADRKTKSFKSYTFEFSQAKLSYYKDKACAHKLNEWKIEEIIWYIGHEPKRNPQSRWAITFIDKKDPVKRTKEYPYFGNTIAGTSKEEHLQWIAAMLLGQYQHSDLFLRPQLM